MLLLGPSQMYEAKELVDPSQPFGNQGILEHVSKKVLSSPLLPGPIEEAA